jgi:hypothetical protein
MRGLYLNGRTRADNAPVRADAPMRQARRVDPNVLHHWCMRNRRAGPIGRVRTRADAMCRCAGDALIASVRCEREIETVFSSSRVRIHTITAALLLFGPPRLVRHR